jgi:hypothetical protein
VILAIIALLFSPADPPAAQPPAPKPKLVCRESEGQLGSHIRTGRRCLTEEQWEQEDARRDRVPTTLRVTGEQGDGLPARTTPQ